MRRTLTLVLLLASVFCIMPGALAEPVQLQYKFTKGEVEKFTMSMGVSVSGANLPPNMPSSFSIGVSIQQRTIEVYKDGSAKVRQFIGEPTMTGIALPKGKGGVSSVTLVKTVSKDGRTLSVTSDKGTMGANSGGFGQSPGDFAVLPIQAVEEGKSWMQAVPIPGMGKDIMINSKLISAGDANNPQSQAQIAQDYNAHLDFSEFFRQMVGAIARSAGAKNANSKDAPDMGMSMDLSGSNNIYFSRALGKVMKQEGTMNGTMRVAVTGNDVSNGTFNISMTYNVLKTQ